MSAIELAHQPLLVHLSRHGVDEVLGLKRIVRSGRLDGAVSPGLGYELSH